MSLTTAMQIGRSALAASQLGIQVTGNNTANAATPGYARQLMRLSPVSGQTSGGVGAGSGKGVQVRDVQRQVDEALASRARLAVAEDAAAREVLAALANLENTLGELSGNDLSSQLSDFFNVWSERANLTKSSGVVVQKGAAIADYVRSLSGELSSLREQVDRQLGQMSTRANTLVDTVAGLNVQIATSEVEGAKANALRDQRDQVLAELAELMDVTVVHQADGTADVLVGSSPVVLGGRSRGLEVRRETVDGELKISVRTLADGQVLDVRAGQIGGLIAARGGAIDATLSDLNAVVSRLIFQTNRLHATGTNLSGLKSTSATLAVATGDRALAINDPLNRSFAELPFAAVAGGFDVRVRQTATGATTTTRIRVDLDGITNAGTAGTADDTTPEQLRAALDGIPGLNAAFGSDGRLVITADTGVEFSFAEDTSGVLGVMGVNAFYAGTDASDIQVRSSLLANPSELAVGRFVNGAFVENGTALEIAAAQNTADAALGGRSIRSAWIDAAQAVGIAADGAKTRADAATVVRESLEAQRASVSGVSIDEEAINLLTYQRQYQAAARLISVTDELTQQLIALV